MPGTIGQWTESQLAKYVRDAVQLLAPDHLTSLMVDDLIVVGTFTAKGTISYSQLASFYGIGTSGQPGFLNSWVKFGAPYYDPAYIKTEDGWIRLRGRIKSGTIGSAAFQLYPGYRPASTSRHAVDSNGAYGVVEIDASGNVTPTVGSNTSVSLDGIQFKAK